MLLRLCTSGIRVEFLAAYLAIRVDKVVLVMPFLGKCPVNT